MLRGIIFYISLYKVNINRPSSLSNYILFAFVNANDKTLTFSIVVAFNCCYKLYGRILLLGYNIKTYTMTAAKKKIPCHVESKSIVQADSYS